MYNVGHLGAAPFAIFFRGVQPRHRLLGFLKPPEIDQNGWFRFQDRMLTGQRRAGAEPANLVYHWRSGVCVISATHVFGPKHAARSEDQTSAMAGHVGFGQPG